MILEHCHAESCKQLVDALQEQLTNMMAVVAAVEKDREMWKDAYDAVEKERDALKQDAELWAQFGDASFAECEKKRELQVQEFISVFDKLAEYREALEEARSL